MKDMSKFILLTAPNGTAIMLNTDCIEGALVDDGKGCTNVYPVAPQSAKYAVKERPEKILELIDKATGVREEKVWHDLREDPNDLPPIEQHVLTCEVLVCDAEGLSWLAYYSYETHIWHSTKTGVALYDIIKWCYTPE